MFDCSTARPIWMHLFNRLSVELRAPPPLEGPIDTYKSEQLKRIVLRCISSEIRRVSAQPPRTLSVPIQHDNWNNGMPLLEGGRWLLLISGGRVYAYDLNRPHPQTPRCIINFGKVRYKHFWIMAADVDRNESELTFNLALAPASMILPPLTDYLSSA